MPQQQTQPTPEYPPGTLVFAKLKGYPWWPAKVEDETNVPAQVIKQKAKSKGPLFTVLFYGEGNYGFFGPESIRPFDREEVERDLKAKKFKNKELELAVRQALDPSLLDSAKADEAEEDDEEPDEAEDDAEQPEEDESAPAEDDIEDDDEEDALRSKRPKKAVSKSPKTAAGAKGRRKSDASGGKAKNGGTPSKKEKKKGSKAAREDETGEPMEDEEEEEHKEKEGTKDGKEKKGRRLSKRMATEDEGEESVTKMDVEDKDDDRDRKKRRKSTSAEKEDDHKPTSRRKSASSASAERKDRPSSHADDGRDEAHSPTAGLTEGRGKRDNSEEGDDKHVPVAGEDRDFKTKQKKLYHLRHKLQRMVYDKTEIPKEDYTKIDVVLTEVEQFTVTFPLLRETKIGKVMKAACAQNYPDDEFNLKERASQLMKNWKALLPTTEPESSKEGENGAHKSVAGDQVALENSEHPQGNQAKAEPAPMETTADHSLSEHHNGQAKKDDAMPMDVDLHVKEDGQAAVNDAGPDPMEHDGHVTAKHELVPSAPAGEGNQVLAESGNNGQATEDHAMLD